MKLKHHITASIIISALLLAISKSWIIFTSSLISGVLIDIDHILDYLWEFRKPFIIKEFIDLNYQRKTLFLMIVFHSWELLALLSICAFLMSWNPWTVGVTIGFAQHIVLDQIFNKPNRLAYFFLWRLKNGFSRDSVY